MTVYINNFKCKQRTVSSSFSSFEVTLFEVEDFLSLIDSFNLIHCVSGPTHEHGHTLDLVLSYGLSVSDLEIRSNAISDHLPILFEVAFTCADVKSGAPVQSCRILTLSLPVGSLQLLISFVSILPLLTQRSLRPGFSPPAEPYWTPLKTLH